MSSNKPIAIREYSFTDPVLEQLADIIVANITRDMASLAPRGITAATVTALEGMRTDLTNAPTDIEARGLVGEAVEAKESTRNAALVEARRLRTAAQNTFTEDSASYRRFGFTGMDKLADAALRSAMYRFHRTGTALQAQMAAEGIDAAFLAAFLTSITAYDDELDNVDIAEEVRDQMTESRVGKGNVLYKEIVRLCNIGKDVFAPVSEATYNDYVIENYVGSGSGDSMPDTTLIVKGKITDGTTGDPIANASVSLLFKGNPFGSSVVSEDDGSYQIEIINLTAGESGVITVRVTNADGYEDSDSETEATVGHTVTVNVQLTPL